LTIDKMYDIIRLNLREGRIEAEFLKSRCSILG